MAVVWIGHAAYHVGLFRLATDQTNAPQLLPNSLGIATTALIALLEELFFRGWLQDELYRVGHALNADLYSIFALNLLFGLMHFNRGFTFAMSAGFVGMIFSIATLASGSLLPAIVMHVGWNVLMGLARLRPHEVGESVG
jgi:membrane protease YdiL (CAAX protease family)